MRMIQNSLILGILLILIQRKIGALLKSKKDLFTVLSLNAQSLNAKFNKISCILQDLQNCGFEFSAICIQATWFEKDANVAPFELPNYTLIWQPYTTTKHGGLACYVHKKFHCDIRKNDIESRIWEGQFIDISGNNLTKTITLGNIYKPPKNNNSVENIQTFISEITPFVLQLGKEKNDSIIVGDFNINLLDVNEKYSYYEYLDLFLNNGFSPKITLPTRFSKHSCTLIDQIFCKISENTLNSVAGIICSQISDHLPCFICLDVKKARTKSPKYVKVSTCDENSLQNFCNHINEINFHEILNNDIASDPNSNYNILEKEILAAKDKHLPIKTVRFNKYRHKISEWITPEIIKSIKFRDKLYRKLKEVNPYTTKYAELETNLKTFAKIVNKSIREAKKKYYANQFLTYKNDSKKIWQKIREILNKTRKTSNFPTSFKLDGKLITDKQTIADQFNTFFTEIGPKLANKIDCTKSSSDNFKHYLKSKPKSVFGFNSVSTDDVQKIIYKLKKKSSTGHDGISTKLLQRLCPIIAMPLTSIINQSLYTGIFPENLKLAKVLPLFKKGDNQLFNNYRPISLLPSISKVFERVVFNQLYSYFDENGLFYRSQYGFRKGHSTQFACVEFVDKMLQELDKKKIPITIFIDLSKAFDTLNHDIMLHKLSHYGVCGNTLQWFGSYLSNRKQYVDFESSNSTSLPLSTGVPQGSILGPLLFIIYMNDLHIASDKFDPILFADDTTLSSHLALFNQDLSSTNEISESINLELQKVYNWLCINKLSLNIEKTKYMIFHYKQRNLSSQSLNISIQGITIEKVADFCFLGLTLNENLNWQSHIHKISNKISRTLGVMNRMKHFLPVDILRTLYNSLILPHLNYSIIVWGFECQRIMKLQKKCVRVICGSKYNSHSEPLFKALNLLKVEDIFRCQVLKFYYKFMNKSLPLYFETMFTPNSTVHQYETRQRRSIHLPVARTSQAGLCIRHFIPKLLKEIPLCIQDKVTSHSFHGFSQYTKNYFIQNYETDCSIQNCYICNNS